MTARAGYGNAQFLADLVGGISDEAMRQRWAKGDYPDIHRPSIPGWRTLAGRHTHTHTHTKGNG